MQGLGQAFTADIQDALDPALFAQRRLAVPLPSLDAWQVGAVRERARAFLLLCGRQTGKSTTAAILAAHTATMWAGTLTLLISPTLRQSSELFRKTMALVDALEVRPDAERRTQTELALVNGSKIVSLPGSNPDSIRGFSAPDLVIEDESAFVSDKTFVATRPFFATNDRGRHILMTTPYGRRGHFYELWSGRDPTWSRVRILSEECPRISRTFLDMERRTLSDRAYRQEYGCEFLESVHSVFPDDWLTSLVDDNQRMSLLPDMISPGAFHTADPGPWATLG